MKIFEKLRNKGQVSGGAVQLLIFAVLGIVAILIYGQFDNTATTSLATNTQATAAKGNFSNSTYQAFNTLSVGSTVLSAVVILMIVGMLLTFARK